MASKLAVAGIIEGNFTDEGLAAMSDCADMTTALARELTNGIKNEVEDLGAVFKKMAILKPASDIIETTAAEVIDKVPVVTDNTAVIDSIAVSEQSSVEDETALLFAAEETLIIPLPTPVKTTRKKKSTAVHEGQISLFELFDIASA